MKLVLSVLIALGAVVGAVAIGSRNSTAQAPVLSVAATFDATSVKKNATGRGGPNFEVAGTNPNADTGPGIVTAVREQLGLRLESKRDQVTVLIVDRADPPTEN